MPALVIQITLSWSTGVCTLNSHLSLIEFRSVQGKGWSFAGKLEHHSDQVGTKTTIR